MILGADPVSRIIAVEEIQWPQSNVLLDMHALKFALVDTFSAGSRTCLHLVTVKETSCMVADSADGKGGSSTNYRGPAVRKGAPTML
jgi:hypothetical protein